MSAELGAADCSLSHHAVSLPGEEAFFEGPGLQEGAIILLIIFHGLFSFNDPIPLPAFLVWPRIHSAPAMCPVFATAGG